MVSLWRYSERWKQLLFLIVTSLLVGAIITFCAVQFGGLNTLVGADQAPRSPVTPRPTVGQPTNQASIGAGAIPTPTSSTLTAASSATPERLPATPVASIASLPSPPASVSTPQPAPAGSVTATPSIRQALPASAHQIAVGPGYTDVSPKHLVRTSDNRLWIAASDCDSYPNCSANGQSQRLHLYRADQTGLPASFTRQQPAGEPSAIASLAMAVDGANQLHLAWVDRTATTAQNLKYTTFDTTTQQWSGAVETLDEALNYGEVGQGVQGLALALDATGHPHVIYLKGAQPNRRVFYRSRDGGRWTTARQVDDGVAYPGNQKAWHPNLAFDTQGRLVAAWLRGSFNTDNDGTILTRVRELDGSWSGTVNVSGDGMARVTIDQSTSLLITADNRYHLTYINQPDDAIRYAYSDDRGRTWRHNNPGGGSQATHNPSLGPNGSGGLRLYGHGTPHPSPDGHGDNLYFFEGAGGPAVWGGWTLYTTGAFDSSVNTRWSQFFFFHASVLDVSYWADPYPNTLFAGVDVIDGPIPPTPVVQR